MTKKMKTVAAAAFLAGLSTFIYAQDPHAGLGLPQGGDMPSMEGMFGEMNPAFE